MTAIELITVCGIGVGLAMDAFAVSAVSGSVYRQLHIKHALRMAFFFGGFQALMPLLGWLAGEKLSIFIASYDHWVAFGLLALIGGKMIYEAFKIKNVEDEPQDPSNMGVLLTLSVATSIDALVVGITLTLVTKFILEAVLLIGIITFAISFLGWQLGKRAGHVFENKIEILGGLILIAIGLKILLTHLLK
ncbi:MAG: manganese efflux pump [Planctomycetes bacterium]|nr:manganese efflux pump [Planctomycetota bacterium]